MSEEKKKFVEQAAPEFWFSYAMELAEAADDIFRKSRGEFILTLFEHADGSKSEDRRPYISRPVLLLYGIAIENLIKGLLISEDTSLLRDGKLSKSLQGHNLSKLVEKLTSFQLLSTDKEVIELLSDVVPYHGRYPVPRSAESLKPEKYISEKIYIVCTNLFERLSIHLYKLNYDGLDAPEGVRFANLRLTHLDKKVNFNSDPQQGADPHQVSWAEIINKPMPN